MANGGPVKLVLREHFRKDEHEHPRHDRAGPPAGRLRRNDRRPAASTGTSTRRSTTSSSRSAGAERSTTSAINEHGRRRPSEFIASTQVTVSTDVQPDIDRLQAADERAPDGLHRLPQPGRPRRPHARPGHRRRAIAAGQIDHDLPYIKREASERLSVDYASVEDADHAIDGLRDFYATRYPLVAKLQGRPSQRGHRRAQEDLPAGRDAGDAGHRHRPTRTTSATRRRPAASAATTAPTTRSSTARSRRRRSRRPARPATRSRRSARPSPASSSASGRRPTTTGCGSSTTRRPRSRARPGRHDRAAPATRAPTARTATTRPPSRSRTTTWSTTTRAVIEKTGAQACAYCHQPAYCAQCHSNPVLPNPFPDLTPEPSPSP